MNRNPHIFETVKLYGISVWIIVSLAVLASGGGGQSPRSDMVRYISNQPGPIDVIVIAHQDDWQLFMGDVVARQARTGRQVVFIYLTAGDYGRDAVLEDS